MFGNNSFLKKKSCLGVF